jgi:tRNA(Ser,Leu) C12 N-acetylase TAN1
MIDDWNVVITLHEGRFREARQFLQRFGEVSRTDYFNVLAMKAEDPFHLLEQLQERLSDAPDAFAFLARVVPIRHAFTFRSALEFEDRARELAATMIPRLAGRTFFVRMHRRGFKGRLSSMDEERFLDDHILHLLEEAGSPGRVGFTDPDAVMVIETIGQRAGSSLFTREELQKFSLLKLK